jgi:hypothetical protein
MSIGRTGPQRGATQPAIRSQHYAGVLAEPATLDATGAKSQ